MRESRIGLLFDNSGVKYVLFNYSTQDKFFTKKFAHEYFLDALTHTGNYFFLTCEYEASEEEFLNVTPLDEDINVLATELIKKLRYDLGDYKINNIRGKAIFYSAKGTTTFEDLKYAAEMVDAKDAKVPTDKYKKYLSDKLNKDTSGYDKRMRNEMEEGKERLREYWSESK